MIRLVTIPDAGHLVHCEQPAAFLDAVIPFLARRERARDARRRLRATRAGAAQAGGGRLRRRRRAARAVAAAGLLRCRLRGAGPPSGARGRDPRAGRRPRRCARVLGGLLDGRPRRRLPARLARLRQHGSPLHLAAGARPTEPLPELWFLDLLHLPTETTARLQPRPARRAPGGARALVGAAGRRDRVEAATREPTRPAAARPGRGAPAASPPRLAGTRRARGRGAGAVLPAAETTASSSSCSPRRTSRCPSPRGGVYVTGSDQVSAGPLPRPRGARGRTSSARTRGDPPRAERARGARGREAKAAGADVVLAWIRAGRRRARLGRPRAPPRPRRSPLVVLDRRGDELSDDGVAVRG